jgi:cyclopropane-fatty-acyl-phospholipid synthase
MSTSTTKTVDNAAQTSLFVIENLLSSAHSENFAVRLWDGTTWESRPGQPVRFTLILRHPGALRSMFLPPSELNLGEAYIYNDFDIEGEIEAVFPLAQHFIEGRQGKIEQVRFGKRLLSLPKRELPHPAKRAAHLNGARHSKARDRQAITYHYDRSNDFYALWLDSRMVYSCAYFVTPDDDLDTAQEQKLEYLCHKLRLKPGERLLDIGCGWGGLVLYAAQHYGVEAYGITLSQQQAAFAQERILKAGVADRCRVEVRDYRELTEPNSYDKLVSVGMFEHVGKALLPTYFQQAWRLLRPGGVFLNHGIACNGSLATQRMSEFVDRYVFPDGELVPISTTLHIAEKNGFEVRDVESLREHYARTLRHWVRRLEAHADEACKLTDDVTYRIWRLYMAGSAYSFQSGQNNVYQSLLVKPDRGESGLPLTRADWYA